MKFLVILLLILISNRLFSQGEIRFSDFEAQIRNNISLFESAVRYLTNCKISKEYRLKRLSYTNDIFTKDAIIEVLPSPDAKIDTCSIHNYFLRIMNYCKRYDLTIIKFNTLIEPREFKEIIYEGKVAYSVQAVIRQCTSFYKILSKNSEIPKVELMRPEECTDKVLEFVVFQRESRLGIGFSVKLNSIRVVDGQYKIN